MRQHDGHVLRHPQQTDQLFRRRPALTWVAVPQWLAGMQEHDHAVRPARLNHRPHSLLICYIEALPIRIELSNTAKAQSRTARNFMCSAWIARHNRTKRHNLAIWQQGF